MRNRLLASLAVITASLSIAGCGVVDDAKQSAGKKAWPGCKEFPSQEVAQKAWEALGSPKGVGGGEDGVVCESLPSVAKAKKRVQQELDSAGRKAERAGEKGRETGGAAKTKSCRTQKNPVPVILNRGKYPQATLHIETAIKMGQPSVFHIERSGTDQKREDWQKVVPDSWDADKDGETDDRDEIPQAMSREGGRNANIALIRPSDNRGAGSTVGGRLRKYCDGQAFTYVLAGKYPAGTKILVVANKGKRMNKWVTAP